MPHDDPAAGDVITAGWAIQLDTQGLYTPALTASTTDPTLGTGSTQQGIWHRNGHLITVWFRIIFGTGSSPGSGNYEVSVPPFAMDGVLGVNTMPLGTAYLIDVSTTANRQLVSTSFFSTTTVHFRLVGAGTVSNNTPFTWADGDFLSGEFRYLADPAGLP